MKSGKQSKLSRKGEWTTLVKDFQESKMLEYFWTALSGVRASQGTKLFLFYKFLCTNVMESSHKKVYGPYFRLFDPTLSPVLYNYSIFPFPSASGGQTQGNLVRVANFWVIQKMVPVEKLLQNRAEPSYLKKNWAIFFDICTQKKRGAKMSKICISATP